MDSIHGHPRGDRFVSVETDRTLGRRLSEEGPSPPFSIKGLIAEGDRVVVRWTDTDGPPHSRGQPIHHTGSITHRDGVPMVGWKTTWGP